MKNIDFLGGNLNFNIDKTPRLTSNFGGIFTIILGLFLILLFVGLGRNFYKRINPIVVRSPEIPLDYTFINITNYNLSVSFRFENFDGNVIEYNDQMFYIKGKYLNQKLDKNGVWEIIEDSEVVINPCSQEMFPEKTKIRDEMKTTDFNCPIFDNKEFGGFWDGNKISYYTFSVEYCAEGYMSPSGKPCLSDNEKDKLLDKIVYISLYYQKLIVDPTIYEFPITKAIENVYYILDKRATKDIFVYFNTIKSNSDYGWLLEQKQLVSEVGVRRHYTDIYNIVKNESKNGNFQLAAITLHYSKEIELYTREYMKIQTLAANIGGILKIILLIGAVITFMYNEYKTILEFEFITNQVENDDKNEFLRKSLNEQKKKLLKQQTLAKQQERINLKQVQNLNDYNNRKEKEKPKNVKAKSTFEIQIEKDLIDYENYNSKEIFNSNNSKNRKFDENNMKKYKDKKYKHSVSPIRNNNVDKIGKYENHKLAIIGGNNKNTKHLYENDIIDVNSIIKRIEDRRFNHYDSIGFIEVLKFMFFTITCEGLCCYTNETKKHYIQTYNNFTKVLEFDEFIKDKIQLKRITELVLTDSQLKLIRM